LIKLKTLYPIAGSGSLDWITVLQGLLFGIHYIYILIRLHLN